MHDFPQTLHKYHLSVFTPQKDAAARFSAYAKLDSHSSCPVRCSSFDRSVGRARFIVCLLFRLFSSLRITSFPSYLCDSFSFCICKHFFHFISLTFFVFALSVRSVAVYRPVHGAFSVSLSLALDLRSAQLHTFPSADGRGRRAQQILKYYKEQS